MDRHKAHEGNTVPFVCPMIFYTGKRLYKHSMGLFDLFETDQRDLLEAVKSLESVEGEKVMTLAGCLKQDA